ncbi:hypothetical protein DL96DRAFT_1555272 [Flagelloscypha sp. PMI_526]|nr:hypothetical protein DL96DRAFT_1555272 [Flagelloscypha sp. PMI_526]
MQGDVLHSYGSLLFGALFAFSLSGVVFVQFLIYWRMYPLDILSRKIMVAGVWFLDVLHSACIGAAMWDYFIIWFGNEQRIDHIPWPVALTVVLTAAQTLINHFFFIHRIWISSSKNYYISVPIAVLVIARITCACLSLSAVCDVLITGWLCYFLFKMRSRVNRSGMARMVDQLTVYTIENGALTCVVTTVSLICWLTMKTNLIFLGLHFVIGKPLNTRKVWRRAQVRFDKTTQHTTSFRRSKEISFPFPVLTTASASATLPTRPNTLNVNLTYPDSVYQYDDQSTPGEEECTSRHWAHQHPDPDEDEYQDGDLQTPKLKRGGSKRPPKATQVLALDHRTLEGSNAATSTTGSGPDLVFAPTTGSHSRYPP